MTLLVDLCCTADNRAEGVKGRQKLKDIHCTFLTEEYVEHHSFKYLNETISLPTLWDVINDVGLFICSAYRFRNSLKCLFIPLVECSIFTEENVNLCLIWWYVLSEENGPTPYSCN